MSVETGVNEKTVTDLANNLIAEITLAREAGATDLEIGAAAPKKTSAILWRLPAGISQVEQDGLGSKMRREGETLRNFLDWRFAGKPDPYSRADGCDWSISKVVPTMVDILRATNTSKD